MKIKFLALIVTLCFFLNNSYVYASTANSIDIRAKSAILVNADTMKVLYSKNIHEKVYPASVTKVLTSLVALQYLSPFEIIIVGQEASLIPSDSSKAGLVKGEAISVENLLRGLLMPSGNDAANVIAYNVALRYTGEKSMNFTDAQKIFATLMNKKAKEIGARESNFENPHGYQNPNHYTTAYDMSLIVKQAIQIPLIREIVSEKKFTGESAEEKYNGIGQNIMLKWKSHNFLITDNSFNYPYATGVKTGFTNDAGDCLAASATKDNVNLIVVLFNSPDPNRWIDATNLFDLGFKPVITENTRLVQMPTKNDETDADIINANLSIANFRKILIMEYKNNGYILNHIENVLLIINFAHYIVS